MSESMSMNPMASFIASFRSSMVRFLSSYCPFIMRAFCFCACICMSAFSLLVRCLLVPLVTSVLGFKSTAPIWFCCASYFCLIRLS